MTSRAMIARLCSRDTTGLSGGDRSAPKQNFADDARASTPLRAIEPFEFEDAEESSQCGTLASHACGTCGLGEGRPPRPAFPSKGALGPVVGESEQKNVMAVCYGKIISKW